MDVCRCLSFVRGVFVVCFVIVCVCCMLWFDAVYCGLLMLLCVDCCRLLVCMWVVVVCRCVLFFVVVCCIVLCVLVVYLLLLVCLFVCR